MVDTTDRRKDDRSPRRLPMIFLYGQARYDVMTSDISLSGASLEGPAAFPRGTMVILEVPPEARRDSSVRLVARVVRGSESITQPTTSRTVGIAWVRAFCPGGEPHLRDFLQTDLGFARGAPLSIGRSPNGEAVFDFLENPGESASPRPQKQRCAGIAADERERLLRQRFLQLQKGRYRVRAPVVYSIDNSHYRGVMVAVGDRGVAIATQSVLPFSMSSVTIRYAPRVKGQEVRMLLYAETEMNLDAQGSDPGYFTARFVGMDEMGHPGGFSAHLRELAESAALW